MRIRALSVLPFAVLAGGVRADEAAWSVIRGIEVDEVVTADSYQAIETCPAEMANAVERFEITGIALPMEEGATAWTSMLVSDRMTCPFCGRPDHAAALKVTRDAFIAIKEGARIPPRGVLMLNRGPGTWHPATRT